MSFANPLLLFGLLGATIPIVIHLINRRRPRQQPFSAIELLMASVQRVERRLRLRRLLLLTSRVLLLGALSLAAARPFLSSAQPGLGRPGATEGPRRLAFIIDASLSMRARFDGQTAFSRAIREARSRIEAMGPEDRAIIVVTGKPPRIPIDKPTSDRGRLVGALDELKAGWQPGSLAEAISAAARSVGAAKGVPEAPESGTPAVPTVITVLSDLARPAIDGAASLEVPGAKEEAELELVDVLEAIDPVKRRNYGFVSAKAESVPSEIPRTVEASARIQSYDPDDDTTVLPREMAWMLGDRELVRGVVDVAPGSLTQKDLEFAFERTGTQPSVLTIEHDALVEDDRHFLQVEVRREVRTLVVDGNPSGIAKEDEVFYLERALEAGASDQPPPQVISVDDLARTDLAPFDVVVLAGVASLSRSQSERIVRFVLDGGGLWVTVSEDIDVESYSTGLGPILPRKFRRMKRLARNRRVGLDAPDLEHPVLRLFEGEALGGLLTTRTRAYLLVEPKRNELEAPLLRFEGGAPAILLSSRNQGRVALLLTSIDRDLTDLPIRPSFVPLVRQIVLWLGQALSEPDRRLTVVGESRDILVPPGAIALEVTGPDGAARRFGMSEVSGGKVRFTGTDRPGNYTVRASYGQELAPVDRLNFAVNVDPAESDVRAFDPAEARAILRGEAPAETIARGAGSRALSKTLNAAQISSLLLVVMGLAFVLESALTALRLGR